MESVSQSVSQSVIVVPVCNPKPKS